MNKGWIIVAALLAGLAQADGPALDAAVDAHRRGDAEAARSALEALARQGVPAADWNLAVIALDAGRVEDALRHMRRAADAGFVTAMFGLGKLHETGRLGVPDLAQALRWFAAAAAAGSVDGMVELATGFYLGRGAPRDRAAAAHWYREAAKGGDVGAQYLIAAMYETGDGVETDLRLARYWYELAAKNGDEAAPSKVRELDAKARAS